MVTPADKASAWPTTPVKTLISITPPMVARPRIAEAARAVPRDAPVASMSDPTAKPSGSLCRSTATKRTTPSGRLIRKPEAMATPSKKVWMARPARPR